MSKDKLQINPSDIFSNLLNEVTITGQKVVKPEQKPVSGLEYLLANQQQKQAINQTAETTALVRMLQNKLAMEALLQKIRQIPKNDLGDLVEERDNIDENEIHRLNSQGYDVEVDGKMYYAYGGSVNKYPGGGTADKPLTAKEKEEYNAFMRDINDGLIDANKIKLPDGTPFYLAPPRVQLNHLKLLNLHRDTREYRQPVTAKKDNTKVVSQPKQITDVQQTRVELKNRAGLNPSFKQTADMTTSGLDPLHPVSMVEKNINDIELFRKDAVVDFNSNKAFVDIEDYLSPEVVENMYAEQLKKNNVPPVVPYSALGTIDDFGYFNMFEPGVMSSEEDWKKYEDQYNAYRKIRDYMGAYSGNDGEPINQDKANAYKEALKQQAMAYLRKNYPIFQTSNLEEDSYGFTTRSDLHIPNDKYEFGIASRLHDRPSDFYNTFIHELWHKTGLDKMGTAPAYDKKKAASFKFKDPDYIFSFNEVNARKAAEKYSPLNKEDMEAYRKTFLFRDGVTPAGDLFLKNDTLFYDYTKPPKYKGGGEVKTNQNKNNYRPTITESTPVEQDTRNVLEELKKAAEALYTQKKTADDSTLENILEIIDPTGATSWDDIYRSYNKTGMSKETFLEMVGALPIVGKFGKGVKVTSKMAKELLKDISLIGSTSKRGMPLAPFIIPPLSVAMSAPYIGRSLDAMDAYNQYPTSPGIPGDSYVLPEVTIKAKRNNKK